MSIPVNGVLAKPILDMCYQETGKPEYMIMIMQRSTGRPEGSLTTQVVWLPLALSPLVEGRMWARRFAAASVRWLLISWIIAWSMLITQPCCFAGAASLPAGSGQSVPHEAKWGHAHQSPKGDSDHDHCDEVASGALTTVATDSTAGVGSEVPPLSPSSTAYIIPAAGKLQLASFPVAHSSVSAPLRRTVYLATARLRI